MTTKLCITCSCEKPLAGFYRHPQMADGHLNKCIECVKAYQAERRRQGMTREYERTRANAPHRVATRKAYAKSDAGKQSKLRSQFKYRQQNREKDAARHQVAYALCTGRLRKQPCEVCGADEVHAHHDDYSQPLAVRWLCTTHHNAYHRSLREVA